MPHNSNTGIVLSSSFAHDNVTRAIATCSRKAFDGPVIGYGAGGQGTIERISSGSDGHFVRFVGLSCSDDAEAIQQARRLIEGQDIELWSGERFIARLLKKQNPPR
jgi:hypothetical protein